MTDQTPADAPATVPPAAPAPRPRRTLLAVVGGLALVAVLCAAVAGLGVWRAVTAISAEQAAITPVLDSFMNLMAARDASGAYRLFASRVQRTMPVSSLEEQLTGGSYILFEGYESLAIESTNLSRVANTNPDVPQGEVATVSGTVTYAGGVKGTIQATLEKEGGTWRIDGVNVTVPPSKFKP